jgi:hypothetical protein
MAQELDDEGKLCSMIMEANKYARYAAVCDRDGKILWSSRRNNVEHLLTEEETKQSLKRAVDSWHAREHLAEKLGKGRYAVVGYENLTRITVPLKNDHLLLVTVEGKRPQYVGDIVHIVDYIQKQPSAR